MEKGAATEAQKKKYLSRIASGELFGLIYLGNDRLINRFDQKALDTLTIGLAKEVATEGNSVTVRSHAAATWAGGAAADACMEHGMAPHGLTASEVIFEARSLLNAGLEEHAH